MTEYIYDGNEAIKETPVAGDKVYFQGESHEFGKRGRPKGWVKDCFCPIIKPVHKVKRSRIDSKTTSYMPPNPKGYIPFDCTKTPTGELTIEEGINLFKDGRDSSRYIENAINKNHNYVSGGEKGYDSISHGRTYETRTVAKTAIIDIRPSKQRGIGRETNINGVIDKIKSVEGYNIAIITEEALRNKKIPYYGVSSARLLNWYSAGRLGKNMQLSVNKFLKLLAKE